MNIWGSSTAPKTSQDTLKAIELSHIGIINASGVSKEPAFTITGHLLPRS
jgi:hypothetical protein